MILYSKFANILTIQLYFNRFAITVKDIDKPFNLKVICRYSKKLYLNETLFDMYGSALFENCGVLPKIYKSGVVCDLVLNGKENCQAVLPKELLTVCPNDFPVTLFCSLIYTENGYFVG